MTQIMKELPPVFKTRPLILNIDGAMERYGFKHREVFRRHRREIRIPSPKRMPFPLKSIAIMDECWIATNFKPLKMAKTQYKSLIRGTQETLETYVRFAYNRDIVEWIETEGTEEFKANPITQTYLAVIKNSREQNVNY